MASLPSRWLVLVAVVVVLLAAIPGIAAAETRAGGTVVVGAGETIDDNLEASGGTVVVHGTVNGDLTAFAGDVLITGTVTGDVEAFAGNVRVNGRVGGDVSAFAGNVEIGPGASIGGTLEAAGGSVLVAGSVAGDARLAGESVVLAPSAAIGGAVEYDAEQFSRAEGASVTGAVSENRDLSLEPGVLGVSPPAIPRAAFAVYGMLVNLALGAVLLLALPRFSEKVARRATDEPLVSGGIGVLTVVVIPVVLVLVAITIIGLPLSLLGAVAFAIVAWVGALYGRYAVGAWLLSLGDWEHRWASLLVGVVVVALAASLPVVGWVVSAAVFLLGLGALAYVLYTGYRGRSGDTAAGDETTPVGTGEEANAA